MVFYKHILVSFCLPLLMLCSLSAQRPAFKITDAHALDKNRYSDIKGSPFVFEEFLNGEITSFEGEIFEDVSLNFNAYTQEIEIRDKDNLFTLNQAQFLILKFHKEKNPEHFPNDQQSKIVFKRGFHPEFLNHFVEMVYDGKRIKFITSHRSVLDEKTFNDVGKNREVKRFNSRNTYYLLVDGELHKVKLKRNDFTKILGHKKEIETFTKSNKLKTKKAIDFIPILEYVERNGLLN